VRRRAGLLAVLLAVAGCGVPTSSDVEFVRPGPEAGSGPPREGHPPPNANIAGTAREQVENFLEAAAGNPESAPERVREYIAAPDRVGWRPEEIRVVRVLEDSPVITPDDSGWRVELAVQQVGVLRRDGHLDREPGPGPESYEFQVVTEAESAGEVEQGQQVRLRIADPPDHMLLADTALADPEYFDPSTIYFWDDDHEALVPDLRWLPTAGQPVDQHPWTVVRWLLNGPAPSLSGLDGMPEGSAHIGTPRWTDDGRRLVVNFNAAAVGQSARDLAYQVAWSLLPLGQNAELELQVDGQPQLPEPIPPPPHPWQIDTVRFAILDGVIRQVSLGEEIPVPVLTDDINQDVSAAALTAEGRLAALVRGDQLVVARAEEGAEPEQVPTGLSGAIGQPVWLDPAGNPAVGLVTAGGRLHRFTEDGDTERLAGPPGGIEAMAVSPEHRRLALVVDGTLQLGLLSGDGDSLTVEDLRPVPTTVREVTGVAFSHETSLVVAGNRGGQAVLARLTVDGAVEEVPLQELGSTTVRSLVAHPQPDSIEPLVVMYETESQQAYTFGTAPNLIRSTNLADAPDNAESSPRAPFFLE
jgi:hypothetical protein